MIGRRIEADGDGYFRGVLAPGDYVLITPGPRMQNGEPLPEAWRKPYWMVKSPNGHAGSLGNHEVVEHEDGTITVSPSILISDNTGELWHGYLERGVWRSV